MIAPSKVKKRKGFQMLWDWMDGQLMTGTRSMQPGHVQAYAEKNKGNQRLDVQADRAAAPMGGDMELSLIHI